MPVSFTNESKNAVSLTNEQKKQGSGRTWDQMEHTWDDEDGTWDEGGNYAVVRESKNAVSLTNESKT